MAKLFIHPQGFRIPKNIREALEADGYIIIAEKQLGAIRVLEDLPRFDYTGEGAWAMAELLKLVIADTSYGGIKKKFLDALLRRLHQRMVEPPEPKVKQ